MARDRRKVVWFEGMSLDPHHLQQWDRYQQNTMTARFQALNVYAWGLTSIEVDRERLANGELRVLRCSGILPDGLVFDVPNLDPAPSPRGVQEAFGATQDRLDVFLALPAERQSGSNYALQDSGNRREVRYSAETISVLDDNTGTDERQIEVARSNFQLRFSGEPLEAYTVLQIARVVRDPSGIFVLDERYVPTCLRLSASDTLLAIARRLLETLVSKSLALSDRARGVMAQRELSPADMAVIGLLSTVNAYIPLVNHHFAAAAGHPEALYMTMLALAGQLSVYSSGGRLHPRDYPRYDHTALTDCFGQLDAQLREMLGEAKPPSNYVQLPLNQQRENLYTSQVDQALIEDAQFFIVARSSEVPEDKLIGELPLMLRISSPQTIEAVLRGFTRALSVEHTSRLPAGMPVDGQANYFQLQKRGPFWESIRDSGAMAIFIPSEFQAVDIKLVAVQKP